MIGVFLYLTGRSARNRLVRQLRRLRTPRYLIALLLGLLYLYAIAEQQRSARSSADPSAAQWVHLLAMLGVVGAVMWAWLFGSERRALVFSPADVTFLFAGPVTRRWLIQYKLLRSQLPVLFNVLLWTLLLSREQFGASAWLRALSLWVLVSTLSLHRLGASFVRSAVVEHGRAGLRRRVVSVAAVIVAGRHGGLDGVARRAGPRRRGALAWSGRRIRSRVRDRPAASAPLAAHAVRPHGAPADGAERRGVGARDLAGGGNPPAALHLGDSLRCRLRRVRGRAYVGPCAQGRSNDSARKPFSASLRHPLPRILRLAPTGWPAGAILWKNLVSVVRVRPVRGAVVTGIAAGLGSALLSFGAGTALSEWWAGWR